MNRMDIRKQLDGLLKGNEDDMGHSFHYGNGVMFAVNQIRNFEQKNMKHIQDDDTRKTLEQNLDLLIRDLEREANSQKYEYKPNKPDPKGDISNVGRDKLDEWAKRNEKLDTKNEEKVLGAIIGAIGDDE